MSYEKGQDHDQLLEGVEFFTCELRKTDRASSRPSESRSRGRTMEYRSIGADRTRRANLADSSRSPKLAPTPKPSTPRSRGGSGNTESTGTPATDDSSSPDPSS
jgi:hypothetical protein